MHATLHDKPVNATHWSTRTLAEYLGVGATTIRRVWRSNGLKPHLSRTFKLSRDPALWLTLFATAVRLFAAFVINLTGEQQAVLNAAAPRERMTENHLGVRVVKQRIERELTRRPLERPVRRRLPRAGGGDGAADA